MVAHYCVVFGGACNRKLMVVTGRRHAVMASQIQHIHTYTHSKSPKQILQGDTVRVGWSKP